MLNALKHRIGIDLFVLNELDRCETIGVKNARKSFDSV